MINTTSQPIPGQACLSQPCYGYLFGFEMQDFIN